mmetsp:Transcript_103715/g.302706  ORF Transcript_103715/g.302706 Transcript_103715/m.302706 type:complete len:250 (-) Transcript_103715:759-1508(-)
MPRGRLATFGCHSVSCQSLQHEGLAWPRAPSLALRCCGWRADAGGHARQSRTFAMLGSARWHCRSLLPLRTLRHSPCGAFCRRCCYISILSPLRSRRYEAHLSWWRLQRRPLLEGGRSQACRRQLSSTPASPAFRSLPSSPRMTSPRLCPPRTSPCSARPRRTPCPRVPASARAKTHPGSAAVVPVGPHSCPAERHSPAASSVASARKSAFRLPAEPCSAAAGRARGPPRGSSSRGWPRRVAPSPDLPC